MQAGRSACKHALAALAGLLLLLAMRCAFAQQYEGMILEMRVNQVPRGEFTVYRSAEGDFFARVADIAQFGVRSDVARTPVEIEGERFVSLRALGAHSLDFNAKKLTLGIELPPEVFARSEHDLGTRRRMKSLGASANSAFLNYRLSSADNGAGAPRANSLATEIGFRAGDFLLRNEAMASEGARPQRFATQLVYDRPAELQRYTAGDYTAYSGELGSSVSMGGLNLSKVYQMAPYLVRQPLAGFAGVASTPSRVEVRVGGAPVARQDVPPGPFELQNLRQYGGARDVEIVVRDALGREQSYAFPFYFSDQSLHEGLHEYNYSLGKIRLNPGSDNEHYGQSAFSAYHRFGYSDALTLGARAEAAPGLRSAGAEAVLRHDRLGVFSGALSASERADRSGAAALASYSYQQRAFGVRAIARRYSPGYAPLEDLVSPFRRRAEYGASASWFAGSGRTLSLDRTITEMRDLPASQATRLSISQNLGGATSVFATLQRVSNENGQGTEFYVGFMYRFDNRHTASVNANRSQGGNRNTYTQFARTVPIGEGAGYRLGWSEASPQDSRQASAYAQWNAPAASLTLDSSATRSPDGNSGRTEVAAFGALAWTGGAWGFTRRIDDSFAIVRVGSELEDVRVSANSQEIGRTDAAGQLIVPNVGAFYESRIGINGKDVPLDYAMARESQSVTPAYRSGTLVDFGIHRVRALEGVIRLRVGTELKDADNLNVRLTGAGPEREFTTGRGGRYYVEGLTPGSYRAEIEAPGARCAFTLSVPASEEVVLTLPGASICE